VETIIAGALYLVSTPIGNLDDITYRAVHILKNVTVIAAEDTRVTARLLQKYNVQKKMISYHSYNQNRQTAKICTLLHSGQAVALVTDAGTPGILDPAYNLVNACVRDHIRIIPIPGPSALLTALVASGLPAHQFIFEGFLPVKKGRKTRINSLQQETRTIILYESPHRLIKTLKELEATLGDRPCVIARELTKKYEEILRGKLSDMIRHFSVNAPKGEFVLLIKGYINNEQICKNYSAD
jgi:16S rRNA (cytidine1402-2'-O)-methyltransferase